MGVGSTLAQIKHIEPDFFRCKNVLGSMLCKLRSEIGSESFISKAYATSLIEQASPPTSPLLSSHPSIPAQSRSLPLPLNTSNQISAFSVIPVDNTVKSDTIAISTKLGRPLFKNV